MYAAGARDLRRGRAGPRAHRPRRPHPRRPPARRRRLDDPGRAGHRRSSCTPLAAARRATACPSTPTRCSPAATSDAHRPVAAAPSAAPAEHGLAGQRPRARPAHGETPAHGAAPACSQPVVSGPSLAVRAGGGPRGGRARVPAHRARDRRRPAPTSCSRTSARPRPRPRRARVSRGAGASLEAPRRVPVALREPGGARRPRPPSTARLLLADRERAHRLPGRDARPRSRPRGRPLHRLDQAHRDPRRARGACSARRRATMRRCPRSSSAAKTLRGHRRLAGDDRGVASRPSRLHSVPPPRPMTSSTRRALGRFVLELADAAAATPAAPPLAGRVVMVGRTRLGVAADAGRRAGASSA